MKKNIAILLLCAMVLTNTVSCGNTATTETDGASSTTETVAEETVKETTVADTVTADYGTYDYEGYAFPILGMDGGLHWYRYVNGQFNEIWFEEDSGEPLNSAIYTRNLRAEELLNIKITPVWGGGTADLSTVVKNTVSAGDSNFDTMLGSVFYGMNLAANGYLLPFQDVETLDMTKLWWDQSLINTYTMPGNNTYVLGGHYNSFDDFSLQMLFYNEKILTDISDIDMVEIVKNGDWTIDVMMELVNDATFDLDGDGQMTLQDAWGFMDNGDIFQHFQLGFNIPVVEVIDGEYRLTLEDERMVNALEKLYNVVITSPNVYGSSKESSGGEQLTAFIEDRCLFSSQILASINKMRDMESDFYLIPMPKVDENQEAYSSAVNPVWCTVLSIPQTVSDMSRTGIILEVLSGFSTETVDKSVNEQILGAKLVRNEKAMELLAIVRESTTYDFGALEFILNRVLPIFQSQTVDSGFTLVSKYASSKKSIEKALQDFLDKFIEE